ncbi:hypothetical protein GCM10027034_17680 [Ramlibacter solisilvae]|nr:hypothetical protein [Ramlibacter tataouinensis]
MSKLAEFRNAASHPLEQNRLLFESLRDDTRRAHFYGELRRDGCPVLKFKSVMSNGGCGRSWPSEDVYFVSRADQVSKALKLGRVEPYAALDSGGRFMLALDDQPEQKDQHMRAMLALQYSPSQIEKTGREAVRLACIRPLKQRRFDVVDIAQQAALHFVQLLFGLDSKAHVALELAMQATYTKLSFQIVGRHFVSDSGLPPDSPQSLRIREELVNYVRLAAQPRATRRVGEPRRTVIERLHAPGGKSRDELVFVALGLMAGTIGNMTASVAIAIDHFFRRRRGRQWLIDIAIEAAQRKDMRKLEGMVDRALSWNPPAPFLARVARDANLRAALNVPDGAQLLLALGVDAGRALRFGGNWNDCAYPHRCVGQHLAWPLLVETIRQVLVLPGLSRVLDPATAQLHPLEKRWGAMCTKFPLQYQRDRRLNQQPLYIVLPIKEPVAENARALRLLTAAGAHIVEDALAKSDHVHFAWFELTEDNRHLVMCTVYDGDFDAYVEHFALDVPLFDKQFDFLDIPLPRPIKDHPKQFVEAIRRCHRAPLGDYFFSAYPLDTVADIYNAGGKRP